MNNESTTNINSCSDFDDNKNNNRIGDEEDDCNLDQNLVWSTWEELLLAYAVKRHGFTAWESVAEEVVRSKTKSSLRVSPRNCRLKYQDLNRRFRKPSTEDDNGDGNSETVEGEDGVGEIPWLEELRSLCKEDLRREIQRSDVLIPALELGLKLKEEKYENDGDQKKPDLEENDESNLEKSKSNEVKLAKLNQEMTVSAAESDRENRSMNESNSTASNHERVVGDKTGQACENSVYPDLEPVAAEPTEKEEETVSRGPEMSISGELDESGTSTGQVITWSKNGRKYKSGEDFNIRGGDNRSAGDKSQPLIDIIEFIRLHPRGPLFESRLRSQKTKNYKRLIRQHLDIKTIEKKLNKGSYVSSNISFYRDLKLLFTNAIVYYPTSSSESLAAHELKALVSNEIKKEPHKSSHKLDQSVSESVFKAESELLISKQKSPDTLVACKTKSSLKKASPSSSSRQKEDKKPEEKEKIVTGVSVRSSRRNNKAVTTVVTKTRNNKKHTDSKDSKDFKSDSSKDDHEKEEETRKPASDKKKSVTNFLKRIENNSPEKGKETSKDENKSHGNLKKDTIKVKPRELRSNSVSKKKAEVENISSSKPNSGKQTRKVTESAATRKRGSKESRRKESKEPKKRSRR